MQKVLIVLTLLLVTAVPVFAKNDNTAQNNSKKEFGQSHSPKNIEQEDEDEIDVTPSPEIIEDDDLEEVVITPTLQVQCDPGKEWKNHGEYVSCVAKSAVGGQKVSEAARSKIGEKGTTPLITPSVSPSITPSISPTITPDPNASPSPTITPTGTPEETEQTANSILLEVISVLESIKSFLETLNPFE